VSPLVQQLLELLKFLRPAPGTSPDAVRDVLRAAAAFAILQDPAQANLPPGDLDPAIADAIQVGAQQAAALKAAGSRLRSAQEPLPVRSSLANTAEQVSSLLGPFVLGEARLTRFAEFRSNVFRTVNERSGGGILPTTAGELWMLLPQGSTSDAADNLSWTLPAGTVWIQSRFLLAGSKGLAGLRIVGGKVRFDANPLFHGILLPHTGAVWTLSLQPEQPQQAADEGNDADVLNLQLPTLLEVHSNQPPQITGDLLMTNFGSDLHMTPSGPVFADVNQICFPLKATEPKWSIAGNRSQLTQFSGGSSPDSPRYTIPISMTPPDQIGEAAHGGSLVFTLREGLSSTFTAQQGNAFRWLASILSANQVGLEIQSAAPVSDAHYDLGVWGTSVTELRFSGLPLNRLIFHSERGALESVGVFGGSCVNKWDLPCRADGPPFEFDGAINTFGFVSTVSGPLLVLNATAPASSDLAGFVLENLYAIVRPPREVFLLSLSTEASPVADGSVQLLFDVGAAIPTLPDPYAANLGPVPAFNAPVQSALRVTLAFKSGATPTIAAHLDAKVPFPEPRFQQLDDPDEQAVYGAFQSHLQAHTEFLYLLDLSSREHLFGVALESPSDGNPEIVDNRLSIPLSRVRLLMQPQVQWEPVRLAIDAVVHNEEAAHSKWNGGPTLVGANSVKLVPVLPGALSDGILEALNAGTPAAALFSLPFGLRAMARLEFVRFIPEEPSPATFTVLNEPAFSDLKSARQFRLFARSTKPFVLDPARVMPGMMRQLPNLVPTGSGLKSVVPSELASFGFGVPLHHADLSGYGLSTFSEWLQPESAGASITKVEFHVLNGRTAYEVIQLRSILYECGARVIRTVVLERHNSGWVSRMDSGWVAAEEGDFTRSGSFQKGAVKSFQKIRRIRITGAMIPLGTAAVQPVIFDADADIEGAIGGPVPIYDRPGYVQVPPQVAVPQAADLTPDQLKLLFAQVGAIGSPVDCAVRVGGTLDAQISSIVSDFAPGDHGEIGFAVAVVGSPKLPRAGQWTFVRMDPGGHATSPVDPRRGIPMVRNAQGPFRFREPSDTRLTIARVDYALLMATETSRALFGKPSIDPSKPGKLSFDVPPLLADPYSLVQSASAFPHPDFALQVVETPSFAITEDNLWRIDITKFTPLGQPVKDFMKGAGWGLSRDYEPGNIGLDIDSGLPAPFHVETPVSSLNLDLPEPFRQIMKIRATYKSVAGGVPELGTPDLVFGGALQELTNILDSLASLLGLKFPFQVSVKAGSGPSPSFVVHMELLFRLGAGPDGRIDIGMGKFYGQIQLTGELETALTGLERALLFLEFQGDIQQGILPPLLYAGGLFRFSIELRETGPPVVQLTLGIVISLGGDLIPGLIALEATLNEGYSLIPATLDLGVLLGIEARAKLLGGLIGFSFSAEAMARIERKNLEVVTIHARIRVAATVHIAIFFDEDIGFDTQFQQDIPLAVAVIPPATLVTLAAAVPL
jgi:hypothetical protein